MSNRRSLHPWRGCFFLTGLVLCLFVATEGANAKVPPVTNLRHPVVLTQLPPTTQAEQQGALVHGMLRRDFGDQGRLIVLGPDGSLKVLSEGFHSACDPSVSFNGLHILFAGKRNTADPWHIFEMGTDGSDVRQVTQGAQDHRSPSYQPTFYTIVSPKPWYQLTFVQAERGTLNETGGAPATNLYSCKLDGSAVRRLTYNLSSDMDPFVMPDGRLLLASWQRSNLSRGPLGRINLFGVNIDGTDYAAFCGDKGKRIKQMPCTTSQGLAVFVESDRVPWDGAGTLGGISLRRPLHDYRVITQEAEGLFHSPSPLPDGNILVSRRSTDNSDTHGLFRLNPDTARCELVFDAPDYHEIQAKAIVERAEPDGRSSIVTEEDPHGKLYCLNVNLSDVRDKGWLQPGMAKKLRVLEGLPRTQDSPQGREPHALVQRRLLGEINISEDGSFNVEIPGSIPIELQTLDANGMALRSCAWIWAKNHEPRGCIGCHEDGELTPENTLIDAVTQNSIPLTLPPAQRRTVDFRRDVMPIISGKCVPCHDTTEAPIRLTRTMTPDTENDFFNQSYRALLKPGPEPGRGKYVDPGQARTSAVIWHIFGKNTSRPWDGDAHMRAVPKMPENSPVTLTEDEKRTFVEWIDLGALWDGIPGVHQDDNATGGSAQ